MLEKIIDATLHKRNIVFFSEVASDKKARYNFGKKN